MNFPDPCINDTIVTFRVPSFRFSANKDYYLLIDAGELNNSLYHTRINYMGSFKYSNGEQTGLFIK